MKKWEAIIFDLDDTLYPERQFVLSGFRAVAESLESQLSIDRETGYAELKQQFDLGIRGDTFDRWLKSHNTWSQDLVQRCVAAYRNHTPTLSPFPGVNDMLKELRKTLKVGLVSDGYVEVQRKKLLALKMQDYFDAIVFSDELGRNAWKPSIIPFETVLKRLSCSPGLSIYVGDNSNKDFVGPIQLGMFAIRVKTAGGEYSTIDPPSTQHAANVTIDRITDIRSVLGRSLGEIPS